MFTSEQCAVTSKFQLYCGRIQSDRRQRQEVRRVVHFHFLGSIPSAYNRDVRRASARFPTVFNSPLLSVSERISVMCVYSGDYNNKKAKRETHTHIIYIHLIDFPQQSRSPANTTAPRACSFQETILLSQFYILTLLNILLSHREITSHKITKIQHLTKI